MRKSIFILMTIVSSISTAQTIRPLELSGTYNYGSMSVHRCFDKNIHSLLLEYPYEQGKYYKLDDNNGDIILINIDETYLPISFFSEDTLLVRHKKNKKVCLYDINNDAAFVIDNTPLSSILTSLPLYVNTQIAINKSMTGGVFWNDSIIVGLMYSAERGVVQIDTFFHLHGGLDSTRKLAYLNVFFLTDTIVLINTYNIEEMSEYTSIFDTSCKKTTTRKSEYLFQDCIDGQCIAWNTSGTCFVLQFDRKASTFIKKKQVIPQAPDIYGRIGFVSKNTVAWYTGLSLDYTQFEPIYNQQRIIEMIEISND